MKRTIAVAVAAALLVACAVPGPYLTCGDVSTAECEAAHEEAVTNGLFLDDAEEVTAALVQPSESTFCNDGDDPFVDVSFTLAGRSRPLVVSVGRTAEGGLVVCTY
jgi:hypothetical protein